MPQGKASGFSFSSMGIDAGIQVGVSIVMASISARLNRKSLKDFDYPEIDPTRKIPYVAGTVKLDSPQIIDWYDFKRTPIHLTTGGILSYLFPVIPLINLLPFGYRYYLGMTIAMCLGEDVVLEKVYAADKTLYSGTVTGGSTFTIDAHGAFGSEGGMYAVCDFASGTYTQSRNAYYATQRSHPPAHRGVAMLYYGGPGRAKGRDAKIKYSGYVSRTNYIRPFAFKVRRCPDLLGDGFHNISGEANPAHVIVDLLTSTVYGMGVPSSQIDITSFEAASETLYDEGYGTSFVWDRDEEVQGVLQRMVDLCDGALFTSPTTGKWTFNLIRRDYTPSLLPLLDQSNIVEVLSYTTRTPDEAVNEVRIDFLEIATDFKKASATWRSLTNHRIRGEREPVTLHHPVGNKTTANKLASREGLALALPLKHLKIKVNREAFNFSPGSAFRFSWPEYGIVQEIYRVSRIDLGSLTQNTITLDCVLDRFGFGAEMYGEVVDFNWINPVEADSVLDDGDPQSVNSVALTPPVSPLNGDAYIVDAGATGDFAGQDGTVATYFDGTWTFTSQDDDTRVYNEADGKFYDVSGGTWTDAQVGLLTGDVTGYLPELTVVGLRTQPLAEDLLDEGETWVMGPDGELIPTLVAPQSLGGVNLQTGTTYTFDTTDRSKLVSFSNASPIAATLPEAGSTGFDEEWFVDVENRGVGTLTITPTDSTVDGDVSIDLEENQGIRLFSDGSNWYTQRGMTSAGGGGTNPTSGVMPYNNAGTFADSNITRTSSSITTVNSGTSMRFSDNGASAPAISFTTQTTTGLWVEGSDQFHFSVAGKHAVNLFFATSSRVDVLIEPTQGVLGFGSTSLVVGFWLPRNGQMAVVSDHDVPPSHAGTLYSPTENATTSGTNWVINFDVGNVRKILLDGTHTNVNAATNPKDGTILTLIVQQSAGGGNNLTWDSSWKWTGGSPPTITSTPNAIDIFQGWSDGTNIYEIARSQDVK